MLDIAVLVILTTAASTAITYMLMQKAAKNIAIITKEEWEMMKKDLIGVINIGKVTLTTLNALPTAEEFQRYRSLAEQANILCEGMMPDSGITARKVGSLTVTTGIPNQG